VAQDALLAHTSPLTWEHIGFSGDFLWDRAATTAGRRRPLNLGQGRMAARPAFLACSRIALSI
jgi:hypothetical protein